MFEVTYGSEKGNLERVFEVTYGSKKVRNGCLKSPAVQESSERVFEITYGSEKKRTLERVFEVTHVSRKLGKIPKRELGAPSVLGMK